jgi:hypothetical protein
MSNTALAFLLTTLFGSFISLLIFNVFRKVQMSIREKSRLELREAISKKIDNLIVTKESKFNKGLEDFVRNAAGKGRNFFSTVDEYLLDLLELAYASRLPGPKSRERIITIAQRMDFPAECMAQIRDRNPRVSAIGSRRAGLYMLSEAVDDMIAALDNLSSENQFEILMGLTRIGMAEPMLRAFEKIKNNVIINERAVIEILCGFPSGREKEHLFRKMIFGDADYITALFLKAMNAEMVELLTSDIRVVMYNGNKEVRIAAVRALAALGSSAPAEDLMRALDDSDWEVRAMAAKALGSIQTTEASKALFGSLQDQQWWVRQNSANALLNHPGYEVLFILAAEIGEKYILDSIIGALDNGRNPFLVKSLLGMTA